MIVRDYCSHWVLKKCFNDAKAEGTIAIAHDDDLRLIKDVVSPARNAVSYARSNQ